MATAIQLSVRGLAPVCHTVFHATLTDDSNQKNNIHTMKRNEKPQKNFFFCKLETIQETMKKTYSSWLNQTIIDATY